jgi:nitroimidazol reductase NimA-like FMN-containing flavoprotein (pyridoxamine 5'-phosphate oxidase superfamily)
MSPAGQPPSPQPRVRSTGELPSPRTRIRRLPQKGRYDRATIHAILDEALICHVGFTAADGQPFVLPTIHARVDDTLYLHGSSGSRMLTAMASGTKVCVTATLLDGLVLARSGFEHSMNYRCAVVLGTSRAVTEAQERQLALRALIDHMVAGRSARVRMPNRKEDAATAVVALSLHEASAKVSTGPPTDEQADLAMDVWAGVLPLALTVGVPQPDPLLDTRVPVPEAIASYRRPQRS